MRHDIQPSTITLMGTVEYQVANMTGVETGKTVNLVCQERTLMSRLQQSTRHTLSSHTSLSSIAPAPDRMKSLVIHFEARSMFPSHDLPLFFQLLDELVGLGGRQF